jgi:hypothetical protein
LPFKEDIREYSFAALLPLLEDTVPGTTLSSSTHSQYASHSQTFLNSQSQSSSPAGSQPSSTLFSTMKSTVSVPESEIMSVRKKKKLNHRQVSSEETDKRIDAFIESMDLMNAIEDDGYASLRLVV